MGSLSAENTAIQANGSTATSGVCDQLSTAYPNNATFTLESTLYGPLRESSWSHTTWEEPSCIFVPKTVEEVQGALPIIVKSNTKFAIRSGGHMPAVGSNSVDDGVLIDLSLLDAFEYSADDGEVTLGPGLRWEDVYGQLDPLGVTVVGGRVINVGVGGFPLGCGLSYLSELYGLGCDNILNAEVILADGSLVNANVKENSDLFTALKGGSNNFGIVVSYKLKVYPINAIYGGTKVIAWEHLETVLDALRSFQAVEDRDPYASLNLNCAATNQTDIGIILTLIYLKPEEKPEAFKMFYDIPTLVDTVRLQGLTAAMSEFPTPALPRIRFMASTHKPTEALNKKIMQIMSESPEVQTIKSVTAGSAVFSWQAISPSVVAAGADNGGNVLGLEPVMQSWFHIDLLWWNEEDDETVRQAGEALMSAVVAAAKEDGSHLDYIFMHDASERQEVINSYGSENVAKLKAASKNYDPNQVFQKLAAGAFKLPA